MEQYDAVTSSHLTNKQVKEIFELPNENKKNQHTLKRIIQSRTTEVIAMH
ncbi:hypothetical protein [Photorhabdus bodei]|uniref:Uncharacterized protein n=1 Tax=Photorhabdus bodei TaxID=2029681 RepID=A0AAW6BMJ7_9GAMM|nr:hypothetical protein [Photorhabdus bodei]MDB6373870.1 hypothetical protein [Photorhabdus bodei]